MPPRTATLTIVRTSPAGLSCRLVADGRLVLTTRALDCKPARDEARQRIVTSAQLSHPRVGAPPARVGTGYKAARLGVLRTQPGLPQRANPEVFGLRVARRTLLANPDALRRAVLQRYADLVPTDELIGEAISGLDVPLHHERVTISAGSDPWVQLHPGVC